MPNDQPPSQTLGQPLSRPPGELRFGNVELQPQERRLLVEGRPVVLGARAFDLLMVLVERAGHLVTKHELLERVWPGLVVEENNLQVQVSTLRKALGPGAVTTIPGRGYRFALEPGHHVDSGTVPLHATAASGGTTLAADAAHPSTGARTNLPARLPSLIGRAKDVEAVKSLLLQHVVVTIVGAGGIGKTRLAQTVAAEAAAMTGAAFPDGVWWVELAALSDGTRVPSEVARALGLQVRSARSATEAVCALASRQLLLVLDNCEHLTDAVAAFIEAVCASVPGVRVLVTSQEPLKTTDEHVYRLSALAVPAADASAQGARFGAVELFIARARAVDPRFELNPTHLPAIVEVCRRLDGIPLAIELAAARLPLLGVEGLRARLDERFNVLTGGSRVVLRRHQTLRATLEWSHGLLTPDERTVLRRLGVFAGSFTLEAAQDVTHDERISEWAALDHLGALVDKSLVLAEGEPVPRYRLLETTRAFALERLAEAGETQALLRRHAEALTRVLARYDVGDLRWRTKSADHASLAAEIDNLRAALAWAENASDADHLAVALAGVSQRVWVAAFQLVEGLEHCLALRARLREDDSTPVAARFWLTIAKLGQYTRRRECYDAAQRAAAIFHALGENSWRYDALVYAAALGQPFGYVAEIEHALEEAARIERPEWTPRQRGAFQLARYRLCALQDRKEEALAAALRQAALYREDRSLAGEQFAMSNVVSAETELGRPQDALEHARTAIARLDALGAGAAAGHLHDGAVVAATLLGRLDEALEHARSAYALLKNEGDEFRVLESLVLPVVLSGRLADAATMVGFLDALHQRTGEVPRVGQARYRARAVALIDAGLGAEERALCRGLGATLNDERAFTIAFGGPARATLFS